MALITDDSYVYTETIVGTTGDDLIIWRGGPRDLIYGDEGQDTLSIKVKSNNFRVETLDSGVTYIVGLGSNDEHEASLYGIEKIEFTDKIITISEEKSSWKEPDFNEIYGSKKDDILTGTNGADYLWGHKGDDELFGGGGDDLIVGGKGFDYIEGGKGDDHFGVSKKFGKGKKNWDLIADFEVGEDMIYIEGSSKGMWIDNYEGDAILVRGKKDIIAWVEGAGGQLDWSSDGTWIM